MKLLIDNCVSHVVASALRAEGHDVESVGDWPADPGDRRVLAEAVLRVAERSRRTQLSSLPAESSW